MPVKVYGLLKMLAASVDISIEQLALIAIRIGLRRLQDKETVLRLLHENYPNDVYIIETKTEEKSSEPTGMKKPVQGIDKPPPGG